MRVLRALLVGIVVAGAGIGASAGSAGAVDVQPARVAAVADGVSFAKQLNAKWGSAVSREEFAGRIASKFAPAASVQPLDVGSCPVTIEKPHASTGSGGADVKARFTCKGDGGPQYFRAVVNLWVCSRALPSNYDENTIEQNYGCVDKADNLVNGAVPAFTVQRSSQKTQQAPVPGSPLVHGSGYWAACVGWTTSSSGGPTAYKCFRPAPYFTA